MISHLLSHVSLKYGPLKQIMLGVSIVMVLTSCGFHLRSHGHAKLKGECISLMPKTPWDPFYQSLHRRLEASGMKFKDEKECLSLTLSSQNWQEQSIAFGADGQVHRSKLMLNFDMTMMRLDQKEVKKIALQREIRINPNDKLSSDEEIAVIRNEMLSDAIDSILQKLEVVYKK